MKPNSFDLEHELLASARGMVEKLAPILAEHNTNPDEKEWHAATVPYRRLKAAVAQYDQRA